MNDNYGIEMITPTPDEVLAVFQDQYRQLGEYDSETDPTVALTFDTTIAEWRDACDLVGWRQLGRALGGEWNLKESDATWHKLLTPARKRTLGDLCEFLAPRIKLCRARPAKVLGRECLSAGVFLTVRSILQQHGCDISELAPSSELAPFTRRQPDVFLRQISQLAPNALPKVKLSSPESNAATYGVLVGLALLMFGSLAKSVFDFAPRMALLGGLLFVAAYLGTWILGPSSVSFGSLVTFRDLSVCIAQSIAGNSRNNQEN